MMQRNIDADELLEKLDDIYYDSEQYSQRYSHSGDAKDAIQNTLDHIQNIVHSLLNEHDDTLRTYQKSKKPVNEVNPRCRKCGAKMDGG